MNSAIFRAYDIRGVVDRDFTSADVPQIGQAFASIVIEKAGPHIVVGYDGRLTSPALAQEMIVGLKAAGAHVTNIGLCPTPQLYFAAQLWNADGAVMVTGSHNPLEYNGFKFVIQGQPLFGERVQDIRLRIERQKFQRGNGSIREIDVQEAYLSCLLQDFRSHYTGKNLTIAWDPANGATGDVLVRLLEQLPGTHHVINETIDGHYPNHHPDPTVASNLTQLIALVHEKKCDLGISFDGDGDRIGVVDAKGRIIDSDQLLALLAEEVLQAFPGATLIADVKSSQSFFDAVERLGGNPLMWRTGRSLIQAKMAEVNSPLAGEMSGHIMFCDRYYGYDDALYAALRLVGILMQEKKSLADWRDEWPCVYNTPELHIPCDPLDKFELTTRIRTLLQQQGVPINDVDGVRINQPDGWWLLRPSNTQEILTGRAESQSQQGLQRLLDSMETYLAQCGLTIKIDDLAHV